MAANVIPQKLSELFTFTEDLADGLAAWAVILGIVHNTEARVRADLLAAVVALDEYRTARDAKRGLVSTQTVADSNGRAFIGLARNVLAVHLGSVWSQAWEPTGFPDQSTATPSTIGERQALLAALKLYFTNHPAQEVAALNITAARAETLFTALSDARSAVNAGLVLIGQKMAVRETTEPALRKRLSDTISELALLLDPLDPRWEAFGLNRPGAAATSDVADAPVLTGLGPSRIFADWPDARRANHYFVEKQIVGVDPDFIEVARVTESECLLQGLPSTATVRIRIIAANEVGRSQPSDPSEIVIE